MAMIPFAEESQCYLKAWLCVCKYTLIMGNANSWYQSTSDTKQFNTMLSHLNLGRFLGSFNVFNTYILYPQPETQWKREKFSRKPGKREGKLPFKCKSRVAIPVFQGPTVGHKSTGKWQKNYVFLKPNAKFLFPFNTICIFSMPIRWFLIQRWLNNKNAQFQPEINEGIWKPESQEYWAEHLHTNIPLELLYFKGEGILSLLKY